MPLPIPADLARGPREGAPAAPAGRSARAVAFRRAGRLPRLELEHARAACAPPRLEPLLGAPHDRARLCARAGRAAAVVERAALLGLAPGELALVRGRLLPLVERARRPARLARRSAGHPEQGQRSPAT